MSSFYTNKSYQPDRNKTDWDEAEQIPLPNTNPSSTSAWPNSNIASQLSQSLRQNTFMESQIQFLKKNIRRMVDKNSFLQDQHLSLKEKYQSLQLINQIKQKASTPVPTNQLIQKTQTSVLTNSSPPSQQLTKALLAAGKTINQQRKTLHAMNQLLKTNEKQNWKFLVTQKKRQMSMQTLNTQLQNYLMEINNRGHYFQKLHTTILNKKEQEWMSQIKKIKLQYEKELSTAHTEYQKKITQTQKEKETKLKETEKTAELLMNEKIIIINKLNQEIKNLSQHYTAKEVASLKKITEQFKKTQTLLLKEKTDEMQAIKKHYSSIMENMQYNHHQELKKLKEQYQTVLHEQSYQRDERMIELKEEHDNQIHLLRTEMEQELIAEKKRSKVCEKTYNEDIQKLQKDFRNLKSEMELNTFKKTQLEINENELAGLRKLNQELQKKNTYLQNLWQQQQPEMEQQQQQIENLQKLNRELSCLLKNYSTETNRTTLSNESNFNTLLQDIHVHTEID